jgi:predicted CoA-substrate-specific enzyme activase
MTRRGTARIGIDIGSIRVHVYAIAADGREQGFSSPIRGRTLDVVARLLGDEVVPFVGAAEAKVAVTGQGASLAACEGCRTVNEILAAARGAKRLFGGARTVIDLGGQLSKWVLLDADGGVADFATNGLCAAGAGAFLEQQAGRLLMGVEEFGEIAATAGCAANVAGRCSVFAKSDMIHLQQRGTPVPEIALGVCAALARMFVATVLEGRTLEPPVALIGGGAKNAGLRRALAEAAGLGPDAFLVPPDPLIVAALGAALLAEDARPVSLEALLSGAGSAASPGAADGRPALPRLAAPARHVEPAYARNEADRVEAYLGVDVGSVSTNIVLYSPDDELLAGLYLRTRGAPVQAIAEGLAELKKGFGGRLEVLGVGTTGSGRHLAARLLGADVVRNEITAQMVSTHRYMPDADTVFEIGGQDSKFIRLRRGLLAEFEMNKICAAGTGSFLEEQAEGLGISIFDQFAALAFAADAPVDLGSKCTVFIETELRRAASEGERLENLCAGLAYAVARNYLEKVAAGREIGGSVAFQGGTASNAAVVAAFESLLGRRIAIHPHNRVSGAIGAALIAKRERARTGYVSRFAGLDACAAVVPRVFECKACENLCQVTRFEVRGAKVHFGDVCERYAGKDATAATAPRPFDDLFTVRERLFDRCVEGARMGGRAIRGEIGVPRASVQLELAPLFATWLAKLGYAPVLSGATTRETVDVGGRGLPGEICLPVKVAAGHVRALVDGDPSRPVFAPSVIEVPGTGADLAGCTCFLTQEWPFLARARAPRRVATPQFGLAEVGDYHEACRAVSEALGLPLHAVARALGSGLRAQREFAERLLRLGREALAADFDRAVVVIGRPYNLHDRFCNLNLARHLERVGLPAIPVDMLPLEAGPPAGCEESVPWRYGRQALAATAHLARDPRLFPIVVSSYGCGVDGFVQKHLEEALGNRPHLLLEFDEHRGEAGLITRLEAFADEIDEHVRSAGREGARVRSIPPPARKGHRKRRYFIPHLAEFSHVYAGILRSAGNEAVIAAPPTQRTISSGEAHCSGRECHPFAVVAGQLVELVESGAARDGDAFLVPSSISPCLIQQYGDAQRIIQARMGATVPEIVDIPSSRLGEFVGFDGVLRFYEGLTGVDLLLPLARRVRPYAEDPAAPLARLAEAGREIEEALAGLKPVKPVVAAAAADLWAMAVKGAPGDRPIVGVTGDLYTRFVDAGNAGLFDRLERLGLEVWASPFYAACSQMSDTHDRRRDLVRWKVRDAARRTLAIGLTTALYRAVARTLPPGALPLVIEPEPETLLDLARPHVGPASSWMYVLAIGKIADFLSRGADGAISVAGVNCMIGTAIAGAVPAVRAAFGGAPIATLTYGGSEGPAQRIKLETFAHQVAARSARNRSARR